MLTTVQTFGNVLPTEQELGKRLNITMSANGISTLSTKQLKQEAKLAKATAKRQGKVVALNGTITGSVDATKPYYRAANTLDITRLPTKYTGNAITDNANPAGLLPGRPWTT